jgi:hypothetical protein
MNKALKNPNVYYIGIPAIAALWAVIAGMMLYPKSVNALKDSKTDYQKAQKIIEELVSLEPKRLTFKVDENTKSEDFDFTKTINEFAKAYSISPSDYNIVVRGESRRAKRIARSASISIKKIDIEKLAQFLSAMLFKWPDLNCDTLSFDKIKDNKNSWSATISLTYYY